MLNFLNAVIVYAVVFGAGYCFGAYHDQSMYYFNTFVGFVKSFFQKQQ